MNQFEISTQMEGPDCTDSLSLAERELAAFVRAVSESFGSELVEYSAEAWLGVGIDD